MSATDPESISSLSSLPLLENDEATKKNVTVFMPVSQPSPSRSSSSSDCSKPSYDALDEVGIFGSKILEGQEVIFSPKSSPEDIEMGSESKEKSKTDLDKGKRTKIVEFKDVEAPRSTGKKKYKLAKQKSLINTLVEEEIYDKTPKKWHISSFTLFAVLLPMFVSLWYAAAMLLPPEIREDFQITKYFLWTPGDLRKNSSGQVMICPRASICSEGIAQILLIATARITAFASYVTMGLTFFSKMHSTINFLSSTYLETIIPFASLHKIHKWYGLIYAILAILHTIVHLVRWSLRRELGSVGLGRAAVSGYFATFFMILIIWSVTLAKRMKWMTFERRFNVHWLFTLLAVALCFHTKRTRIITLVFVGLWFLDYLYGYIFRTHRLEINEFTRLPDGCGTQMLWRNPEGFRARSGEFVRVKIPWLSEGGDEWHAFSLYLNEATKEGLREIEQKETNRIYSGEDAKGGKSTEASKTAVLLIECQNEFASPGGKLHDEVRSVMQANGMLEKLATFVESARGAGAYIFHAPITFKHSMSNNPNAGLGILKTCRNESLFLQDTWNADFVDKLRPATGDIIVKGKTGLDSFPGTNLEQLIKEKGIETLILGGFLTNCCVESTMRTAYEKGLNVITLTDGTACKSNLEQVTAVQTTFKMFSTPVTCAQAVDILRDMKMEVLDDTEINDTEYNMDDMDIDEYIKYTLENPYAVEDESFTMKEARQDLTNQYDTTQVFIAAAGDWSTGLSNDMKVRKEQRACWVRGPYTSPYSVASHYNHFLLMASGIGITPALAVMAQYPGSTRTKVLIWLTKSKTMLKFFAPLFKDAHMVLVFYTGKEKLGKTELKHIRSYGNTVYVQQSRPASLEKTMASVIVQYEIAANDERMSLRRITSMETIPPKARASWCVLYCGGSIFLKDKFKKFTKEWGIGWQSELFDW